MKIQVKLFAAVKQAAGSESVEFSAPGEATVGDVRRWLCERFPPAAGVIAASLFAIDGEYAAEGDLLAEGVVVACIPPVSGG